jgi:hypothetical protein
MTVNYGNKYRREGLRTLKLLDVLHGKKGLGALSRRLNRGRRSPGVFKGSPEITKRKTKERRRIFFFLLLYYLLLLFRKG